MAAITVTTELDDLRVLFNQMDEIYYKSTPIASTDIATSLTVDMEWPVLEDGVSFDTGAADVTEIKLTTQAIWTTKAVKGDADISFQVASIKGTINDIFMDKVISFVKSFTHIFTIISSQFYYITIFSYSITI